MMPVFRFGKGQRFGPALSLTPARAIRIIGLLEFARVGQICVRLAGCGYGLFNRSAERERIKCYLSIWAQGLADLLQFVRAASGPRIRNGKEAAVARAHTDRIRPPSTALSRYPERRHKGPSLLAPLLNEGRLCTDSLVRKAGAGAHGRRTAPSASAVLGGRLVSNQGENGKAQRRRRPRPQNPEPNPKSQNEE